MKQLLFVILPLSFMVAAVFFYNKWTDGFSLHQLRSTLPFNVVYETEISPQEKERIAFLLSQPYHYIGKGCQFYAFESADGKYVLKFLKHKHLRTYLALKELPLPACLQKKIAEKNARRKLRMQALFSSCRLAYEELPEETGLIFVHLGRSPLFGNKKKVRIYDKLGMGHKIEIDKYEFLLQKKGLPARELLQEITAEELAPRMQQLMALVKMRSSRGIADKDTAFIQNIAFSREGEGAFFIDVGQFYPDPLAAGAEAEEREILRRFRSLELFLEKERPDLLPTFHHVLSCRASGGSSAAH